MKKLTVDRFESSTRLSVPLDRIVCEAWKTSFAKYMDTALVRRNNEIAAYLTYDVFGDVRWRFKKNA